MWIRSQDKLLLTNVDTSNGIMINEYPDECLISLEYANTSFKLGEYSSKEKALNVLDEIQDAIEDTYYYRIDNIGHGTYALGKGVQVYQMPQDWEVEV
ncbi:MAG: hypothetical protein ACLT8P_05935 [Holdemanella porci]|uniref:hypothetical protein n=1 Tax=Holdemanella porci TaxID=2652276 RepID=UPI003995FFE9